MLPRAELRPYPLSLTIIATSIYPTSLSLLHNARGRYDFYLHLQMRKWRQRDRGTNVL